MKHLWQDINKDKTEILEENLFLYKSVHYQSKVDCPGIVLRPLQ
jgi:hypothetical protein